MASHIRAVVVGLVALAFVLGFPAPRDTAAAPQTGSGVRDEIDRAQRTVREAEAVLAERELAVGQARQQFEEVNRRLYGLQHDENKVLEWVYLVYDDDLKLITEIRRYIRTLNQLIWEDPNPINRDWLIQQRREREARLGELERQTQGRLAERRAEYDMAVQRYLDAGTFAARAQGPLVAAVAGRDTARKRLSQAHARLATLRAEAPQRPARETPPHLVAVEASSGGALSYGARWAEREDEVSERVKRIQRLIGEIKKVVEQREADASEALEDFGKATAELNRATGGTIDALWRTMWYDVLVDAAATAVQIAADVPDMGLWALPYQAIEQSVEWALSSDPTGPDIGVLYNERAPSEGALVAATDFLSARTSDVIQSTVAQAVEAGLGGGGVNEAVRIDPVNGELHLTVRTAVLSGGAGGDPAAATVARRIRGLGDLSLSAMKAAALEKISSPEWWKERKKDLLLDAAIDLTVRAVWDVDEVFQNDPAIPIFLAAKSTHEWAYRTLVVFQVDRNIARQELVALEKLLEATLDEQERTRNTRSLNVGFDRQPEGADLRLSLTFSSEMDRVAVTLDGRTVEGSVQGRVWTGVFKGGEAGTTAAEAVLAVNGVERTSRKGLDGDAATQARFSATDASGWIDVEDGPDRAHRLKLPVTPPDDDATPTEPDDLDGLKRLLLRTAGQLERFAKEKRLELLRMEPKYYWSMTVGRDADIAGTFDRHIANLNATVQDALRDADRDPAPDGHMAIYWAALRLYVLHWSLRNFETSVIIWNRVMVPHNREFDRLARDYDAAARRITERLLAGELTFREADAERSSLNGTTRRAEIALATAAIKEYDRIMVGDPGAPDADVVEVGALPGGRHGELLPIPERISYFKVEPEVVDRMHLFLDLARSSPFIPPDRLQSLNSRVGAIYQETGLNLDVYGHGYLTLKPIFYSGPTEDLPPLPAFPNYRRPPDWQPPR